jgi:hypothetical protein
MVIYNCIFMIVFLWLCFYDCVFMMWFHKNAEFILWLFIIVYLLLCFYDVISQNCGIHFMVIYNCIFIIVYLWCDFTKLRNSFYGLFIYCVFMMWFHKIAEFILWFIHLLCFYDVISQNYRIHFMVIYNCIFIIVYLRCNFTKLRNSSNGYL